jgi:hypothetical protein
MKKYFTAATILTFAAVLIMSSLVMADETRQQFERSSRNKATVGLFKDSWDNLIDFAWFSGTLTNENYLWTNLANLQSDNVYNGTVNKSFRDNGYDWAKDEKEDILGTPGWDSNNSFALGYLGNPVGTEGWNMGFVYNYQTADYKNETDNSNYSNVNGNTAYYDDWTINADQSYDTLEHLWLLNGGIVLSEQLGIGFSWYHWNNDQKWNTSQGSETRSYYSGGSSYSRTDNDYEYKLKDIGDTLALGAFFQLNDDLAVSGVLDIDYNQTKINYDRTVVVANGGETNYEGYDTNNTTFLGNEDRSDFGFDLELEAVKKWGGDFWERTEFYVWVGWHPEDGDYWGSNDNRTSGKYTVYNDIDGDISYDEINWGAEGKSFINFGDRVHFAWGMSFSMYNAKYDLNYDWVDNPGQNSSTVGNEYKIDYDSYYWSFPVALEVDFLKYLTGRVGARWSLTDYNGDKDPYTSWESNYDMGYNPDQAGSTGWYSGEKTISNESRNTSTAYSFGLGWKFNEYLQIDLTDFTDLTDMNDWQLSLTLKW